MKIRLRLCSGLHVKQVISESLEGLRRLSGFTTLILGILQTGVIRDILMILSLRRSGRITAPDLSLPEVSFVESEKERHMPEDEIDKIFMPLIESL